MNDALRIMRLESEISALRAYYSILRSAANSSIEANRVTPELIEAMKFNVDVTTIITEEKNT